MKAEAAVQATEGGMLDGFEERFPVPSISSIRFIPITTIRPHEAVAGAAPSPSGAQLQAVSPEALPFWIQFDDVESEFLELRVLMDSQAVDPELRMYLQLYEEILFELPIDREGLSLTREEVVAKLHADSIHHGSSLGIGGSSFFPGSFPSVCSVGLKFENDEWALAIQWLTDVLWHTRFDAESGRIGATRLLDDVPCQRRSAHKVCRALLTALNFDGTTNTNICNFVKQAAFLTKVKDQLETDPQGVIDKLEALRTALTQAARLRVQCIGKLAVIAPCKAAWLQFLPQGQRAGGVQLPDRQLQCMQGLYTPGAGHRPSGRRGRHRELVPHPDGAGTDQFPVA